MAWYKVPSWPGWFRQETDGVVYYSHVSEKVYVTKKGRYSKYNDCPYNVYQVGSKPWPSNEDVWKGGAGCLEFALSMASRLV